jgi:hypothetical protein
MEQEAYFAVSTLVDFIFIYLFFFFFVIAKRNEDYV